MPDDEHEEHDGFEEDDDLDEDEALLDAQEIALIEQDLRDLGDFERAFAHEGYRGVAVWCHDCSEEHYYPWAMLRENLQLLLDTGETPVHEPAFAPEPDRYVQWEYARGYTDALRDTGADQRLEVDACSRCNYELTSDLAFGNFCPRCGHPLLTDRLRKALERHLTEDAMVAVLRAAGLPQR